MTSRSTLVRTFLPVLILALALVGCTSDDDELLPAEGPGDAQAGVSEDLTQSALSNVPIPSAAEPAGGLQEVDGRQTQSYIVTADTPEGVHAFYEEQLPANGWEQESREELSEGIRSTWTNGNSRLLIATLQQDQNVDLSLQLTNDGATPPNTDGDE